MVITACQNQQFSMQLKHGGSGAAMLLLFDTCTGYFMYKHHIAINLQVLTLLSCICGCVTLITGNARASLIVAIVRPNADGFQAWHVSLIGDYLYASCIGCSKCFRGRRTAVNKL